MEERPPARCPICDSSDARLRYRITHFRVYDCAECALVYLWPQLSDEEVREMFSRLYTVGEGSVPELKNYYEYTYADVPENPLVRQYEGWLDAIERHAPPGRLLDIGCGTGLFLAVARRRGWQPFGIDDCAEATQHAREHFGLDVWSGEFTEFANLERDFDAITLWDIIEHARKPVELLEMARKVLAPGGVVGLSTPNQRSVLDVVAGALYHATGGRLRWPLEKFYIEQHFLYFSPRTLSDAITASGLEVAAISQEQTDLRRLTLSPAMRALLTTLFAVGRLSGRQNRLFAIGRAANGSPPA